CSSVNLPLPPHSTLFPYTTLFRSFPLRKTRTWDLSFLRTTSLSSRSSAEDRSSLPMRISTSFSSGLSFLRTTSLSSRSSAEDRRSEEHTSELQSLTNLVCHLLLAN